MNATRGAEVPLLPAEAGAQNGQGAQPNAAAGGEEQSVMVGVGKTCKYGFYFVLFILISAGVFMFWNHTPNEGEWGRNFNASCIERTDGACGFWLGGCAESSKAQCKSHRCVCQTGYCVGGNQQCYKVRNNILVASRFTLRSAQSHESLFAPSGTTDTQLSISASKKSEFDLWKLPDGDFLMTISAHPEAVMSFQVQMFYGLLQKIYIRRQKIGYWDVMRTSTLSFCSYPMPELPKAFLIKFTYAGSSTNPPRFSVHRGSQEVVGDYEDFIHMGAVWYAEPALPFKLPPCS